VYAVRISASSRPSSTEQGTLGACYLSLHPLAGAGLSRATHPALTHDVPAEHWYRVCTAAPLGDRHCNAPLVRDLAALSRATRLSLRGVFSACQPARPTAGHAGP